MTWDALRKSINGLINKVNAANIKHILPEVCAAVQGGGAGWGCNAGVFTAESSPSPLVLPSTPWPASPPPRLTASHRRCLPAAGVC